MNRTQLGQIQIEALTGSIYECSQNVATQNKSYLHFHSTLGIALSKVGTQIMLRG